MGQYSVAFEGSCHNESLWADPNNLNSALTLRQIPSMLQLGQG